MPDCHLAGPGIVPSHGEQMFAAGILSPGLEGSYHKGDNESKMLVWRIQWHIMPKLQTRQYDFMPQRGTEDSLYDLMTHIHNELNLKRIIVMVSLDIEGLRQRVVAIRNQLLVHKCPVNLYGMVMGYLRDREAFADDVLMFSGQSASALEAETNRALAHVRDWGDRNKLSLHHRNQRDGAHQKLKFDVPVIRMGNREIALVDEIRLLGLTIDKG
ncbi:hypothetical protein EVAR_43630_1 [Eumeta japonica]|uniref:Uncharacterized protein n=1 Tax=Eumeta variegata TaxID=151549 RepID=A0A4C1XFE4_EUMVA|nr:hypothetical protein EVAR_43630_1 [Eumeta japonica]